MIIELKFDLTIKIRVLRTNVSLTVIQTQILSSYIDVLIRALNLKIMHLRQKSINWVKSWIVIDKLRIGWTIVMN